MTAKKTKTLSVIIVTFQAEKFIEGAILSIVNHIPKEDLELIIIDGMSNDQTVSIIQKYANDLSYFISEKDKGIYDAMNKGINAATGDYIYFLGADDRWIGDYNAIRPELKSKNIVYYGNVVLNPTEKVYDGPFSLFKFMNRNICHQCIFYPREIFQKYTFDIQYRMMADFVLNIKIWGGKDYQLQYIPHVVASYHIDGASTNTIDKNFQRDAFRLIYTHIGLLGVFFKLFNPIRNLFFDKYEK